MADTWQCVDDIDKDLDLLCSFDVNPQTEQQVQRREKPSEHMVKTRTKASLFDQEPPGPEPAETMYRGRGFHLRETATPGQEIYKQLRQAVGLGYSNAVIEEFLRTDENYENANENHVVTEGASGASNADLKLKPITESKSAELQYQKDFPPLV